ncbi:DUF934 domain-containing protein [Pararhizobium haloflavum]|uniref:DUF934 domain-containing protein n=1 Tax=Pararhizobium haloflavum TaxID=2037914 RepID=UPI003522F5C7
MNDIPVWTVEGFVADDPWQVVEAQDELPATGDIVVPLEGFVALSDETRRGIGVDAGRNTRRIGVLISADDDPGEIADMLDDVALVALDFPKFSDGRAFSHAARLREQFGFKGDLRAVGDVLIDQMPLMLRVGITSFAVSSETTIKRLEANRLQGIARHYQPGALPEADSGGYSWRRVSA